MIWHFKSLWKAASENQNTEGRTIFCENILERNVVFYFRIFLFSLFGSHLEHQWKEETETLFNSTVFGICIKIKLPILPDSRGIQNCHSPKKKDTKNLKIEECEIKWINKLIQTAHLSRFDLMKRLQSGPSIVSSLAFSSPKLFFYSIAKTQILKLKLEK